ncbi:hypothetical protein ACFYUK_46605 [Nonomuraea wenchangensis]
MSEIIQIYKGLLYSIRTAVPPHSAKLQRCSANVDQQHEAVTMSLPPVRIEMVAAVTIADSGAR